MARTIGGSGMTRIELDEAQKEALYLRSELLLHLSKISRLEGQVEALIYGAREHNKKIEKLETKQRSINSRLRSHMS